MSTHYAVIDSEAWVAQYGDDEFETVTEAAHNKGPGDSVVAVENGSVRALSETEQKEYAAAIQR
jgi:hypothetical protein